MYNPSRYQSQDHDEAFDLMDQNPFATVITVVEGKPFVSQLPLTPVKQNGQIELIGHLARANPHSRLLAAAPVTVIFHGPHTYITPKWYVEDDVPTWNYMTVQISGTVEIIQDNEGIIECLKMLTSHVERHWPSGWQFYIPEDLRGDILSKSIAGFKIKVSEIHFKKKLSQNRTPKDRGGVLAGLESRSDNQSQAVLKEMRQMYSENGEIKK